MSWEPATSMQTSAGAKSDFIASHDVLVRHVLPEFSMISHFHCLHPIEAHWSPGAFTASTDDGGCAFPWPDASTRCGLPRCQHFTSGLPNVLKICLS